MVPRAAAIVVGLAGAVATAGAVAATAPPAPPPATTAVDTGFLRAQAEAELTALHPDAAQVACAVPPADEPGVRFWCYGALPDGSVLVVEATMNDDGGLEFADVTAGGSEPDGSAATAAPSAYEGTGDSVVQVTPISGLTILTVGHDGTGDVTIQPQNAGAVAGPSLVARAASPTSRYLVGLDGPISALAVTAAGAWSITPGPTATATPLDAATPATGTAPDVLRYAEAGAATVTFGGTGPLTVVAFTASGRAGLVDTPGPYTGILELPAGPGFVTVDAAGAWTVSLGAASPPGSTTG